MSWAEVSKINNDFTTPLNVLNLINHIDMIGSAYNPQLDIDSTKDMLGRETIYSHSVANAILSKGFWDYVLNGGSTNVGRDINQAFRIGRDDFEQYTTVTDLFGEPERVFTIAKYGGRSALMSSFFSDLVEYNGFVSGLISTYKNANMLFNNIANNSILPIKAIRESTLAFAELNHSNNLVLLETVGEGTYTVPNDVNCIMVAAISGGGGGQKGGVDAKAGDGGDGGGIGGKHLSNAGYAGGGGGGAYRMHVLKTTPNTVIPYVVGDGGEAGNDGIASRVNNIQGKRFIAQEHVIPTSSDAGAYQSAYETAPQSGSEGGNGASKKSNNGGGCSGGGGFGGGNGEGDPSLYHHKKGGTGGLTYGNAGGGGVGGGQKSYLAGGGGGGYGGGGGGGGNTNLAGGKGGQGIIALYLGREAYTA